MKQENQIECVDQNQVSSDSEIPFYQTTQQFILTKDVEEIDSSFYPTTADLNIFHE